MSSRKRKLSRSSSLTESMTSGSTMELRHSTRKSPRLSEVQQELPPKQMSPKKTTPTKMSPGHKIKSSVHVMLRRSALMERLINDMTDGPTPRSLIQTLVGQAPSESPVVGTDLTEKLVPEEGNVENMSLENTTTIPDIDRTIDNSFLEPPHYPLRHNTSNQKSMRGRRITGANKTNLNVNKDLESDQPTNADGDKTDEQQKELVKITFESPTKEVVPQQPRRRSSSTLLRKKAMLKNLTADGANDPTPRSLIQNVIEHVPVETPVVGEERADSMQHVQVTPSFLLEKTQVTTDVEESPLEDVTQQHGNQIREKAAFFTDKRYANVDVAEFAAGITQPLNDSDQSCEKTSQHHDTQNLASDHPKERLVISDSGMSDEQKVEKYRGLLEDRPEQANEKEVETEDEEYGNSQKSMERDVDAAKVADVKKSMSNISGKNDLEVAALGNEVLSENEKNGHAEKASKGLAIEGDMETISEKSMDKWHQTVPAITVGDNALYSDEYDQENITGDGSKGQRTATEPDLDNTREMDDVQVDKPGETNGALFSDSVDSNEDGDDGETGDQLRKSRFLQLKITDLLNSPALVADDPPKHNEVSFNELVQAQSRISAQQEQRQKQPTTATQAKKKAPVRTAKSKREKSGPLRMPRALTKSIFLHFCKSKRVNAEVLDEVEKVSDKFWMNIASDLSAYTQHAGRHMVTDEDMKLLMRRQGFVTKNQPLFSLIEEYLPLEYRQELIPIARSGNVVVPGVSNTK